MKKYLIVVLLILSVLYINISGVNAETNPITCDYGIICNYSLPNIADTAGGHVIGGSTMIVYYQCNDKSKNLNECSSFVSAAYASTSSLDIGSMLEAGGNTADELGFQNYNDVFHQTDSFKNQFESNSQFKCPRIYYRGDKIRGVEVFYSTNIPAFGSHNVQEAALKENECVAQNQTVDWNKVKDDAEQGAIDAEEDRYNNESGEDIRDDTLIDTSKIQEWAENAGYDIDSLGDPCTIISPSLKNMLISAFWIISVGGIILVVVMTAISFIKAIVGSDDEKFRDAIKHLYTRIIVIIILLLLPMILTFIINLINNTVGEGKVSIGSNGEDVFCDITGNSSDSTSNDNNVITDPNTGEMTR